MSKSEGNSKAVRPVILCGGSGSRLWPLSRAQFPKQFASFGDDSTLLQDTIGRVAGPAFANPILLTAEDMRFLVKDQVQKAGVDPECLILEQAARNTAPAIALAAQWIARRNPDEIMLVLPSDHVIDDPKGFGDALATALTAMEADRLVTFGIRPTSPHTGYGYIHAGTADENGIHPVTEFVEKPSRDVAEAYLKSADYFWNAGIFLFRARTFLEELEKYAPDIASWSRAAVMGGTDDGLFFRPVEAPDAPDPISVDYAIMERSDRIVVVPADMDWSDLGSWEEVWARRDRDRSGNVTKGEVIAVDTTDSLVFSDDDTVVATLGMKDVLVVVSDGAVLVAPRDRAQDVRRVVDDLRRSGHAAADEPSIVHRPWGSYQTTDRDARFQTKRIIVLPGAKLSSQIHHHRSEHWVVVSGTAEVTVGEKTFMLHENESTYISAGTVHRLANPGKIPLHLVEVQCGSYLGEDDIIRLDDVYGRTKTPE